MDRKPKTVRGVPPAFTALQAALETGAEFKKIIVHKGASLGPTTAYSNLHWAEIKITPQMSLRILKKWIKWTSPGWTKRGHKQIHRCTQKQYKKLLLNRIK